MTSRTDSEGLRIGIKAKRVAQIAILDPRGEGPGEPLSIRPRGSVPGLVLVSDGVGERWGSTVFSRSAHRSDSWGLTSAHRDRGRHIGPAATATSSTTATIAAAVSSATASAAVILTSGTPDAPVLEAIFVPADGSIVLGGLRVHLDGDVSGVDRISQISEHKLQGDQP